MAYCPSCGVEVKSTSRYCKECGEKLNENTEEGANSTPSEPPYTGDNLEAVTVETDEEARHYNVASIAYLRYSTRSLSLMGWITAVIGVSMGFVVTIYSMQTEGSNLPAVLTVAVIVVGLILLIVKKDSAEIGTLTGVDQYRGDESRNFERKILDLADDPISLSGEYSSTLQDYDYRYHFFPKNIVRITQSNDSNVLSAVLIGFFGISGSIVMVQSRLGLGVITAALSLLFALLIFDEKDSIEVDLQGGETKEFTMNPTQAQRVIDQFSSSANSRE